MSKRKIDQLCVALCVIVSALTIALCFAGFIGAAARRQAEYIREAGNLAAVVLSPDTETIYEAEDPFESQRSLEAILAKCQCVPDCYIVGYAPELVAGWRPEYRNENGLYLTSFGMWAGLYHTVATDPAVIPTGATVVIDGDIYIAADTGVSGKVIDVMVDVETALTYGCHHSDVYWCLECEP